MRTEESETVNQDDKQGNSKLNHMKRDVIPIQLALAIGIAFVSIVATFFTVRANLSNRISRTQTDIDRLEDRLYQAAIQTYIERSKVYTQITNLKIIEEELDRLNDLVDRWKPPTLKFGRNLPYPGPKPPDRDVVVEATGSGGGPVKAIDGSLLGNVVTSVDTRGIPDTDIMPKLHHIVLRLHKYNSQIMHMCIGALKEDAQDAVSESELDIEFMKTAMSGLKQKVIDCRHRIEGVLKQSD